MHYRPDVDGLRAVAILPVVFYHAGLAGFPGGFVGVDVFFVISGFVIARLLARDLEAGRFTIAGFYERRIRRLFPALFATLLLSFVLAAVLFVPPDFETFSESALAAIAFLSNVWFWRESGYFAPAADLMPLLHTWSLAVEEQFYIVMPIAMWVIHRWLGRRWLLTLLPAALASFALSAATVAESPTANFYLLPTRAWELLLGALLALSPPTIATSKPARDVAGIAGLAMIAVAVLVYDDETMFPGPAALLPCLGAALVIHAGPDSHSGRLLSLRALIGLGLISYSLYLIHWPLLVFLRYGLMREPTVPEAGAVVLLSLALAALSWRFVEQPIRHPARRPGHRRRAFAGAALAIVVGAGAASAGILGNGLPQRTPGYQPRTADIQEGWRIRDCFLFSDDDPREWRPEDCMISDLRGPKALLWGDSFAAHWVPGLRVQADRIPFRLIQYTAAGCAPIFGYRRIGYGYCEPFEDHVLEIIADLKIETIVLAARWQQLPDAELELIPASVEKLRAAGVRSIYVIGQSPIFMADGPALAYRVGLRQEDPEGAWVPVVERGLAERLGRLSDGTTYLDPLPILCPAGLCPIKKDGALIYSDTGHFTVEGSRWAAAVSFPLFVPAGDD